MTCATCPSPSYCTVFDICKTKQVFSIGGKYNWKGQPERLTYLGPKMYSGVIWHQFEKIDAPGKVWCEVRDADLLQFEESKP